MVYQVLKPLYGMPHSGSCLHVTWSYWLESKGFQKAGYEGAMWSRKNKDGDTILVATHVIDNIVTGSNDDKTDTFVREILVIVTLPKCSVWSGSATSRQGLALCIRGPSQRSCSKLLVSGNTAS